MTSVGASAPEVTAAVAAQAADFTHTCFMISPYEEYVAVCEALARVTPGTHDKRSVLVNSGAEAVENAVKVARRATGRPAVLVLDHAYHGRTNLTMAMTARAMPYKTGFGPFAGEVYRVPASYPLRDPAGMTGEQAALRAIDVAERQVGADQVAALVVEPILGEGGFVVPAPGFLPTLAAWAADRGIVLVADEVQTGFARTGAMFAMEHEGVVPDLVAMAKGIAGGLPLGAVTGRAELMDAVHAGGLGGTFGGNPIACAAALATLELYERDDLAGAARAIEAAVAPPARGAHGRRPRGRGRARPRRDARPRAGPARHARARQGRRAAGRGGVRGAGGAGAHVRHLGQRPAPPAPAGHRARPAGRGADGPRGSAQLRGWLNRSMLPDGSRKAQSRTP